MLRSTTLRNRTILLFAAGLLLRLAVSFAFYGSHDVRVEVHHAWRIRHGLPSWTSKLPIGYFTPPAMAIIAEKIHLREDVAQELPAIAGDLFTAFLLLQIARRRGLTREQWLWPAIFLLNPVTIILSAYHGNIDPVMAAFILWALDLRWRDKPLASGITLGLAVAMKPTALLALPVLLIPVKRKGNITLAAAGVLTPIAICLPFAILDPTFGQFLRNYSGMYGNWGIPMILRQGENVARQLLHLPDSLVGILHVINVALASYGKYLLAAILLAWLAHAARRWNVDSFAKNATLMAATYLVFFVFATGFGPQYISLLVPFLLIATTRISMIHSALLTPYLIVVYVHAQFYADPDRDVAVTQRLGTLTKADLALLAAHGLFSLVAWAACAWALWMLIRPKRAN